MEENSCFHCGNLLIPKEVIHYEDKKFCCLGCKTVFEILQQNDMGCYYDFERNPGATPLDVKGKYDYLEDSSIVSKLLEFEESSAYIVSLYIPHIHCSSCIWILENLQKLQKGIVSSQTNFTKKSVRITYKPEETSLKEIVLLLSSIGYEPYISLEQYDAKIEKHDRSLIYKLGVAFFCFGNIMLLSFPEYFEVNEFWINQYTPFFRGLIFTLSLPSFVYSASGYYISAFKSIKAKMLNIDIPIALGIIVMFIRSTIDIVFDYGQGFFDSLTGLVFFMLLGKLFQQKTYSFLSFERDFKSYFPIAVTKIEKNDIEVPVQIYDVQKGDRLLIRNQELIPVDGILISNRTDIDYSFVTGENQPIEKKSGDKLFAGGKQLGESIEMEVLFNVSQSYLTQLWSNEVFQKKIEQKHKSITDKVSQYFTPALLLLSFIALIYWLFIDIHIAFNVFTAVLIVACPCALALTAPFTLGNVLRIMGKNKMYLKNAQVIEQFAKVDTIVFDKTGTLTTNSKTIISFEGKMLSNDNNACLKMILRNSNHPLSRKLYDYLPNFEKQNFSNFQEIVGKGVAATFGDHTYKIGSADWVGVSNEKTINQTKVHISIDNEYYGFFSFKQQYREGIKKVFNLFDKYKYNLYILSGDNEGEKEYLTAILPTSTQFYFNQKPDDKLNFIKQLQSQGKNVLMVGDGLNDAGALAQSNVGISISENVNVFSPACDAIMDASQFNNIYNYLKFSHNAMKTIYMSFALSLLYNIVGLSFALIGKLSPLFAAIIMPLSAITIVSFVTIMSNYYSKKIKKI